MSKTPRVIISATMARLISAHLERDAEELICSYYNPRAGRVNPKEIRQEIERCRRWAKLLRGGKSG